MSYLKMLKIDSKAESKERRYTFKEDEDKKELIKSVKHNLITSGVEQTLTKQVSQENTEVKIDAEK